MKQKFILTLLSLFSIQYLFATSYYVDNIKGSDSYSGTSPDSAWKTPSKVSAFAFNPGDSILFKRGDVFRGEIDLHNSGTSDLPITYGAYGIGNKPLFLGSVNLNNTSDWTSLGNNRWASSNGSFPSDVGFILFDWECVANVGFKYFADSLNREKTYWYDESNDRIVVYCSQNPAGKYSSIEVARNTSPYDHIIEGNGISYLHFENLEIKFWNSHAMAFTNAVGVEVRNCDISWGGGAVYYGGTARLGNGIEFWTNARDCVVDGCKIGQCFDSGVTFQGQRIPCTVTNIFFNNNILWGNDMANFEIAFVCNETTIKNIHFENNISIGAGRGWSRIQKKHATMGWDVTTWAGYVGSFDGLYLKNNVYYQPDDMCLRDEFITPITNFESDYNYYYKPKNALIYMGNTLNDLYHMSEFLNYQNDKGLDAHSIADFDKFVSQNAARAKVSREDVFFLNKLFQEVDSIILGIPTEFDLISPIDKAYAGDTATLTWAASAGSGGSKLDHYEVWVNSAHVADVPAGTTSYTTSDLKNGENSWFVIALCNNGSWRQSTSKFTFLTDGSTATYKLTITSGSGGGSYEEGQIVNIFPSILTGKEFNAWSGDIQFLNLTSTSANNNIIMPAKDISVTATYNNIAYTLTVENGSGSGTSYAFGQVVNIASNTPPAGKQFNEWTGDVNYIADINDSTTTVTMQSANVSVTATYKVISEGLPLFNWNMESSNVVLDQGIAGKNLTNINSVTTGGTEPNPPGYGSMGAVFNGTDQFLSLSNADYGNRALNGTDTDGTIYVALRPNSISSGSFFWSIYKAINGERQLALSLENGNPVFTWGFDNGISPQSIVIPQAFSASQDILVSLSLDASGKKYTFLAWDVAADKYFSITETDQPLNGTYNTGTSDLVIGGRSDLSPSWGFDGTIYWVRVYDEAHTLEEMQNIIKNGSGKSIQVLPVEISFYKTDITVCPNPAKTTITIDAKNSRNGIQQVDIYNITGKKVFHSSNVAFPYQVDISSLSKGMYIIGLSNGDKRENIKFLKQ